MKLKVFVNTRTPERGLDILEKKYEVKSVSHLHHKIKKKRSDDKVAITLSIENKIF